ncbi:MAG: hypothetical protein OXI49_17540 [Acidobacteriota bacterium]|nr:hypothetical protein [Acidobacteriota bacterium]
MFKDVYCETLEEVFEEKRRRKADPEGNAYITQHEESPYGSGYRVYSIPVDIYADELVKPLQPGAGLASGRKAAAYR